MYIISTMSKSKSPKSKLKVGLVHVKDSNCENKKII